MSGAYRYMIAKILQGRLRHRSHDHDRSSHVAAFSVLVSHCGYLGCGLSSSFRLKMAMELLVSKFIVANLNMRIGISFIRKEAGTASGGIHLIEYGLVKK